MDATVRNTARLVAGVDRDASRAGLTQDHVEVFVTDGRINLVVSGPDGALSHAWDLMSSRFYHAIARGSLDMERTSGGISVTATHADLRNGDI